MKRKILIASTNISRFENIKSALSNYASNIEFSQLPPGSTQPLEDGENELQNSLIKARYYQKYFGKEVLSLDDGVYISGQPRISPGRFLHRIDGAKDSSQKDIFIHWKKVLLSKNSLSGTFKRSYTYTDGIRERSLSLLIPVLFKSYSGEYEEGINPLNFFITPAGMNDTIKNLSKNNRKALDELFILPVIEILNI